jgi:hypothetical protein
MAERDESRTDCPQCRGEGQGGDDADAAWNRKARGETPLQREDRRYGELLQEVRVAQTGVQILLAFLLTVAFSPRFTTLEPHHKTLYVITLLLGAGATALLIAPVSIHRLTFAQRLKPQLVRVANVLTVWGLTLLMLTIGAALLLIFDLVVGEPEARWLTGAVLAWFAVWWYVLPAVMRMRHNHRNDDGPPGDGDDAGDDRAGRDGDAGEHRHHHHHHADHSTAGSAG